jgi:hypothetical protein
MQRSRTLLVQVRLCEEEKNKGDPAHTTHIPWLEGAKFKNYFICVPSSARAVATTPAK